MLMTWGTRRRTTSCSCTGHTSCPCCCSPKRPSPRLCSQTGRNSCKRFILTLFKKNMLFFVFSFIFILPDRFICFTFCLFYYLFLFPLLILSLRVLTLPPPRRPALSCPRDVMDNDESLMDAIRTAGLDVASVEELKRNLKQFSRGTI